MHLQGDRHRAGNPHQGEEPAHRPPPIDVTLAIGSALRQRGVVVASEVEEDFSEQFDALCCGIMGSKIDASKEGSVIRLNIPLAGGGVKSQYYSRAALDKHYQEKSKLLEKILEYEEKLCGLERDRASCESNPQKRAELLKAIDYYRGKIDELRTAVKDPMTNLPLGKQSDGRFYVEHAGKRLFYTDATTSYREKLAHLVYDQVVAQLTQDGIEPTQIAEQANAFLAHFWRAQEYPGSPPSFAPQIEEPDTANRFAP